MSRPFLGLIVRVTLQVPTAIAFTLVPTSLQYLDDDDRTLIRAIHCYVHHPRLERGFYVVPHCGRLAP